MLYEYSLIFELMNGKSLEIALPLERGREVYKEGFNAPANEMVTVKTDSGAVVVNMTNVTHVHTTREMVR